MTLTKHQNHYHRVMRPNHRDWEAFLRNLRLEFGFGLDLKGLPKWDRCNGDADLQRCRKVLEAMGMDVEQSIDFWRRKFPEDSCCDCQVMLQMGITMRLYIPRRKSDHDIDKLLLGVGQAPMRSPELLKIHRDT